MAFSTEFAIGAVITRASTWEYLPYRKDTQMETSLVLRRFWMK
jgi:hypothetical protein